MAQTRPKPNPRPLRVRNQYQPQLLVVIPQALAGDHSFDVSFAPSYFDPAFEGPFVINGLPAWVISEGQELVSLVPTMTPGVFTATFGGAAIVPTNSLVVPSWDGAIRTPQGGYVAPANVVLSD